MRHSPNKPADKELRDIVDGQISGVCDFPDEQRDQLLEQLKNRYGQGLLAVLIYGSYRQKDKFNMLAGRYIEYDIQATVGNDWPFRQQGYPALQMKQYVDKKKTR